ncbi:MAG: penicillin-binding protein activator LpoB [Candidatus Syntrophosphaera sp.]|nr:penicillin-binding protein activator LpoB [Candidatus Syntrophosphaera sp.]
MPLSKKLFLAGLILVFLLLAACSKNVTLYRQASKEYNKGLYENSLKTNVESLRLKPDYAKAQELIQNTYPKVIAVREARILQLQAAQAEDMYDRLVEEYQALIRLQGLVEPLDPLVNAKTGETYSFTIKDYDTPLAQSKLGAAEAHYQQGIRLAQSSENPDVQREAAGEFQIALGFVPNFMDAVARYEEARALAIKRIAILSFVDRSGSRLRYGSLIDLLTDSIIGKLIQDPVVREFTEIVTRDQMNALLLEQQFNLEEVTETTGASTLGAVLGAHEIMTGRIIQINYVPPRITSSEHKESKNMVTGKETYTTKKGKEKTRDIKEDVTCVYRKFTKTASVNIITSFNLIEVPSGRIKLQDTVSSEHTWTDVWGRVESGDIRVLSDEALAMVSKAEPLPPSEVDMVNQALQGICDQIVDRVRDYVK